MSFNRSSLSFETVFKFTFSQFIKVLKDSSFFLSFFFFFFFFFFEKLILVVFHLQNVLHSYCYFCDV